MTWHLKDRELEKKLIERYPDFLISLNSDAYSKSGLGFVFSIILWRKINGKNYDDVMTFCTDELEEVPEYNPKGWNKFPQVWPPENVRMRVEFQYKNKPEKTYHACFYFFSGKWYWDTCNYSIDPSIGNIRFRPWVD